MSWDVLAFNNESIKEMKEKINTSREQIETSKKDVMEAFEELKKDWNTEAGRAFFEEVNLNWGEDVDKFITVLEAVEKLLDEAVTQYTPIEEMVDKLKNKLTRVSE